MTQTEMTARDYIKRISDDGAGTMKISASEGQSIAGAIAEEMYDIPDYAEAVQQAAEIMGLDTAAIVRSLNELITIDDPTPLDRLGVMSHAHDLMIMAFRLMVTGCALFVHEANEQKD